MSTVSLLARLPRIPERAATLRNVLLAALDGVDVQGIALTVEAAETATEGGWIVFDCAPGRILIRLSGIDPLSAADALARHEPLLAAIEAALGVELMPVALAGRPAPDAVVIGLAHGAARAWLAASPTLELAPPRRYLRPFDGTIDIPVTVRIAGASLVPDDLAALVPGDLLLVPAHALATLTSAERTVHGRLTAAPACLRVLGIGDPSPETSMTLDTPIDAQAPPGAALADYPIPITVELANVTATLATLSGLAPGSVLPLGLAGRSLPVKLIVGGRAVATGEMIAFGEGYGVLISSRVA